MCKILSDENLANEYVLDYLPPIIPEKAKRQCHFHAPITVKQHSAQNLMTAGLLGGLVRLIVLLLIQAVYNIIPKDVF